MDWCVSIRCSDSRSTSIFSEQRLDGGHGNILLLDANGRDAPEPQQPLVVQPFVACAAVIDIHGDEALAIPESEVHFDALLLAMPGDQLAKSGQVEMRLGKRHQASLQELDVVATRLPQLFEIKRQEQMMVAGL